MTRERDRLTGIDLYALPPGWHSDGGGLYLRVKPTGNRSWVALDTRGGKRKERGLGTPETTAIDDARRECAVLRRRPVKLTFGEFAARLHADLAPQWLDPVHRDQWLRSVEVDAAALRDVPLEKITIEDVLNVLRPIWTAKPATARRARARIERVLAAAMVLGHRAEGPNPAAWAGRLEFLLPRQPRAPKRHHAAVPWQEMPAFWADLAARRPSMSKRALQFTILTAARRSETVGAPVGEIDRAAKIWTIPAERMKMEVGHQVPLSGAAMAIVEEMAFDREPGDFLFPGTKGGHMAGTAMLDYLRVRMKRTETVHGFRSSFRDWAGEATEFPREIAEMALAHAVGGAAELAYRRGRALEKRRALMEAWAAYLMGA